MTIDSEHPRRRVREHIARRAALVLGLFAVVVTALLVAASPADTPARPQLVEAAGASPAADPGTTTTTIDMEALAAYLAAVEEAEQAEVARAAEEARLAEEARVAEEARIAEEARQAAATPTTTRPAAPVATGGGSGCVIPAYICQRESGHSYTALNRSSGAGGMYQFMPTTWNGIARAINPAYVGVPPHTAPPSVQDQFATYLWAGGAGCGHWSATGACG